jgi:hypothetical protein
MDHREPVCTVSAVGSGVTVGGSGVAVGTEVAIGTGVLHAVNNSNIKASIHNDILLHFIGFLLARIVISYQPSALSI